MKESTGETEDELYLPLNLNSVQLEDYCVPPEYVDNTGFITF